MTGTATILKEIHRLMRYIHELEGKIAAGPRAMKSSQLALARHEDNLKKAHDEIKHLKVQIHEHEVSVKQSQDHLRKLEQTSVSNKKEYEALQVEAGTVKKAIRKVEDEALEFMTAVEEKQGQIPELEKQVQQVKADLARIESEFNDRLGRYVQERDQAKKQLAQVEETLAEPVVPLYKRLVGSKGMEAFSGVQGRICVACYTEITQQKFNELNTDQLFLICANCGRMLYVL